MNRMGAPPAARRAGKRARRMNLNAHFAWLLLGWAALRDASVIARVARRSRSSRDAYRENARRASPSPSRRPKNPPPPGRPAAPPPAPQMQAKFPSQLSKITKQNRTLDSSSAVSTLRLPDARWSSLVARRAHNPKVGGSNPPRATKKTRTFATSPRPRTKVRARLRAKRRASPLNGPAWDAKMSPDPTATENATLPRQTSRMSREPARVLALLERDARHGQTGQTLRQVAHPLDR